MKLMCCVQVDDIRLPCSSGCPFRPVSDMATRTFPSCLLLTEPCSLFPIPGVTLSILTRRNSKCATIHPILGCAATLNRSIVENPDDPSKGRRSCHTCQGCSEGDIVLSN